MSTNPGVTIAPSASSVRLAAPLTSPTSTMSPSSIATSARRAGAPVPSTRVPFLMMASNIPALLFGGNCALRGLGSAHEFARKGAGRLTFALDHLTGFDCRHIALGMLHQSPRAGRKVIHHI